MPFYILLWSCSCIYSNVQCNVSKFMHKTKSGRWASTLDSDRGAYRSSYTHIAYVQYNVMQCTDIDLNSRLNCVYNKQQYVWRAVWMSVLFLLKPKLQKYVGPSTYKISVNKNVFFFNFYFYSRPHFSFYYKKYPAQYSLKRDKCITLCIY